MQIVLVEPSQVVRAALAEMLEPAGHVVTGVA